LTRIVSTLSTSTMATSGITRHVTKRLM
jgi:hypothetical protein